MGVEVGGDAEEERRANAESSCDDSTMMSAVREEGTLLSREEADCVATLSAVALQALDNYVEKWVLIM